jgi:hypothetical protein
MEIDLDAELKRVTNEMYEAEDNLINSGFPKNQWLLIRKYIASAILHSQVTTAKAWKDLPPPAIS